MGLTELRPETARSAAAGRWRIAALALVVLILCSEGTGCYSFSGASVPPHLKTVAVPLFDDQSGAGEPGLRENLTNKLIDLFNRDNNLQVADRTKADSIIEGVITAMTDAPAIVSAGENVTKRRITINVKVTYRDMKLKKVIWDKQLSNFGDYESSASIAARQQAISDATTKLSEDIVLETVSGW